MGMFDKIKNFFYEEDEEEIEDFEPIKEEKKTKHTIEYTRKEEVRKRENKKDDKLEKNDVSERELFRSERTFNFPMDIDDTIYGNTKITKESVNKTPQEDVRINTYRPTSAYQKRTYPTEKIISTEETKKFKPTPIISPIYGVLNKNYQQKDITINSNADNNISKKLDYDTVMKKAYNQVKNSDEDENDNKGIFFNLENDKDESNTDDELKIVYNDDFEEDIKDNDNLDAYESNEEDKILSETKEQDLFNLIDNMYSLEEDEEEAE